VAGRETRDVNTYVHIWVYKDAEDRSRRRATLLADTEWQSYLAMSAEAGYLIKQESKLMSLASFAPLQRQVETQEQIGENVS
jgi:hypothetical protein